MFLLFSAPTEVRATEPSRRDSAGERRARASLATSREPGSSSDSANPAAHLPSLRRLRGTEPGTLIPHKTHTRR